jgi:hypothetical protein
MSRQLVLDRKSHNPIGFLRTAVFIAKEYFHRRRDPRYACDYVQGDKKQLADAHVKTLQHDGVLILPAHFGGQQLQRLQGAFARAVNDKPSKFEPEAFYNEDILSVDPAIAEAALDDFLLQIIGGYYGKRFGLGRASASRLFPTRAERYGSYQWHHDTRGRQIHMMVLLSDVTAKGQRMSYLRRSHDHYYDRFRGTGDGSRFEKDVSSSPDLQARIVEVVGPAGTVALFDSNGLHSGNRNGNEPRDSMLFCYISYPRHFKQISCSRADLSKLPPSKRELITLNPSLVLTD